MKLPLNNSEAGLPPYEAAIEHGAHKCQVGGKTNGSVMSCVGIIHYYCVIIYGVVLT